MRDDISYNLVRYGSQIVSRKCVLCNETVQSRFTEDTYQKERFIQSLPHIDQEISGYTHLPGNLLYRWGNGYAEFHCLDCTKKQLSTLGWDTDGFEYTLQDYDRGIEDLTNKINKTYPVICGIARAGAIPAAHLAMNLSAQLMILDFNYQMSIDFFEVFVNFSTSPILIVDDFINKGNTITKMENIFPLERFDWACLVLNTSCEAAQKVPTIYSHKTIDKEINGIFAKFPWGPG